MISTQELTAYQLVQLDALLADTTPGGGVYRPPMARDVGILWELGQKGLARYVDDVNFETYEILDAGKAIVVGRAMDAAATEAFLRCASKHELRESIERLKAVFNDLTDAAERERTLSDIEACQDALDALADEPPARWRPSPFPRDPAIPAESTGRHRVVPADDRPTRVIPPVEEQTAPMPSTGTLPEMPVVEQLLDPDEQATIRLIAAIRATPTPEELAEVNAVTTAGWQALENDLADERPWWRRKMTPARTLVLSVVAAVVVTWFAAWLVLA